MLERDKIGQLYYIEGHTLPEVYKLYNAKTLDERRRIEKLIYDYALAQRINTDVYKRNQFEKAKLNREFVKNFNIKTVLDAYAGNNSQYERMGLKVTTNDLDKRCKTDYHLDATQFLAKMISEERKFDLVDLDPYGSSYDCWPLAIKLVKKVLVVSYGDFNNWRYKRYPIINARYGESKTIDEFANNLIKTTNQIGYNYGPVTLSSVRIWRPKKYFMRVYYKVEKRSYGIENGAWKLRKQK